METSVALLAAISIASERLVEIIKGLMPYLNQKRAHQKQEAVRRVALQLLAVLAGIVTALLAYLSGSLPADSLPRGWDSTIGIVTIGLLASGGAGFWNAILSYLLQVKDLKKKEALK